MVEPTIARDGHTIFWTCGPVSIAVAMELASPSGTPIMQVVIHGAGKVPKCHGSTGSPSALMRGVLRGGVTVLEGAGILARGTGSCT